MNYLLLFGLLVLNFGISAWNAYLAGAYLTESKIIGGWSRFMTWCGLVMSACGFTWVYLALLAMIAVALRWLTPEWGDVMLVLVLVIVALCGGIMTTASIARWADRRVAIKVR